jgi:eukaryotic-like serine/threonine-protein kinase
MTTKNLGKYEVLEQLGSGGFGTVYKATDSIGRTVAVKVLKPGWSEDPATIERFRREAQAAGALFHNRIATIIDFDEFEGRYFPVMRYIDGISLDRLIKEKGRLGWQESLRILAEAAEELDYAHRTASPTAISSPTTCSSAPGKAQP